MIRDRKRWLGVLAGGSLPEEILRSWANGADELLAADGAADRLISMGILPSVTIGDLDSLVANRESLPKVIQIDEQMTTDCDKLLSYAADMGADEIFLIDVEGGFVDHFLASLQSAFRIPIDVTIVFQSGIGKVLRGPVEWAQKMPGRFSLIPFSICEGVELTGAKWSLGCTTLDPMGQSSISNQSISRDIPVQIKMDKGIALAFYAEDVSLGWDII